MTANQPFEPLIYLKPVVIATNKKLFWKTLPTHYKKKFNKQYGEFMWKCLGYDMDILGDEIQKELILEERFVSFFIQHKLNSVPCNGAFLQYVPVELIEFIRVSNELKNIDFDKALLSIANAAYSGSIAEFSEFRDRYRRVLYIQEQLKQCVYRVPFKKSL